MLKRNLKARKNRVGLQLRSARNYRITVFVVLAVISLFLPFVQTNAAVEGDGRIVYGDATTGTPKTRAWQGNARLLTAEATLPTAGNGTTVKATIIEATSVRDEMIAGVLNSSNVLNVFRWNGTTWTNDWSVTLPATHTPSFDIAYEQVSGKAMVIYSTNTTTNELAYRTYAGSTWTAAVTLNSARTTGIVHAVVAASRPGTNEIAIGYGDANLDLSANYWSGSAWLGEPAVVLEAALARIDTLDTKIQTAVFDLEFEQQSGELMLAWAKEGEDGFRHAFRTIGTGAEWRIGFHTPMNTHRIRAISLTPDPGSDHMVIATEGEVTINSVTSWVIMMARWDGSTWKYSTTTSAMDKPPYGQHRHDVAWVEKNGITLALMMFDVAGTESLAHRLYFKTQDTFGGSSLRTLTSTTFSQVRFISNPHDRTEVMLLTRSTDNILLGSKMTYDGEYLFWVNISSAESSIDTAIATQSTMTGWGVGFAYDLFVPAATLPAPGTPDALLLYDSLSDSNPNHRSLTLATNTWSTQSYFPTGAPRKEFVEVKASPIRNEKIAAVVGTDGWMEVFRWDGAYWKKEWTNPIGAGKTPRFAIAYEQISGRAMVIYSSNVTINNELSYRIWSGSTWGPEVRINADMTNNIIGYIVAKPRPATNEIAIAWGDNNMDLSANYWTGSAWAGEHVYALEQNLGGVSASPTEMETPVFDLAFESLSGELLLMWGHNNYASTDPLANATMRKISRTAGPSGTWGGVSQVSMNHHVRDLRVASDPDSDYISVIFHSTGRGDGSDTTDMVRLAGWDGSGWYLHGTAMGSSDMVAGESDVATAWLTSGGTTISLYVLDRPDASTTGIHYTWLNKTTGTWIYDSVGGLYRNSSAPVATPGKRQMKLINDPADPSKAILLLMDNNNDLFVKRVSFDGTAVSVTSIETGGIAMADDISATTSLGWKNDFVYQNNTPVPSVLAVDIVNASGVSVAAPSVTMTSLMTGNTCQTATGTFGSSGQRIRLQNTTVTPGWTVSLAPTSGSTSNWSSGTATYDFNDAAGATAGCGDGADADGIAGRLTVNPSIGTLTGLSSCSTTGVTRGTSNSFAEGTVNSITLMTGASNAATNCYWDLVGVSLSQTVPASQAPGRYTIEMTVTTVAN